MLVWIDCEMTGLDLAHDGLIEVAALVTDGQLNVQGEGVDVIIKPEPQWLDHMNDFVRNMHTIRPSCGARQGTDDGAGPGSGARLHPYLRPTGW